MELLTALNLAGDFSLARDYSCRLATASIFELTLQAREGQINNEMFPEFAAKINDCAQRILDNSHYSLVFDGISTAFGLTSAVYFIRAMLAKDRSEKDSSVEAGTINLVIAVVALTASVFFMLRIKQTPDFDLVRGLSEKFIERRSTN